MGGDLRRLGTSELMLTRVGFGAWAIGGGGWAYGWGAQDDDSSIQAIRRALRLGVNWVDTAAIYGFGHSEEVVGRAVGDIPENERPYLFTKGGLVPDPERSFDRPTGNLQPASIRSEVEGSLRRLGAEHIDLYQFHRPDETGTAVEDSWAEMIRLLEEGKIRAAGVSNFNLSLLERAEAVRHVDSVQPPFSLIVRDAGGDIIPWSAAHGVGVIVYSPMQSGLLTDSFSAERVQSLTDDDWRKRSVQYQEPNLSRNLALRDALRPVAERHNTTVAAVAVAWTLAWPGVTGAIVGARRADQVDGWIPGASLQLTEHDKTEIADAVRATRAGSGPASSTGV